MSKNVSITLLFDLYKVFVFYDIKINGPFQMNKIFESHLTKIPRFFSMLYDITIEVLMNQKQLVPITT